MTLTVREWATQETRGSVSGADEAHLDQKPKRNQEGRETRV
jgi:hypothetical protein